MTAAILRFPCRRARYEVSVERVESEGPAGERWSSIEVVRVPYHGNWIDPFGPFPDHDAARVFALELVAANADHVFVEATA